LVASMIPTAYMALKLGMAYRVYKERSQEEVISHTERVDIGWNALKEAQSRWFEYVRGKQDVPPGLRTKSAIVPYIEEWYKKSHGTVTSRQIFSTKLEHKNPEIFQTPYTPNIIT